MIKTFTFTNTSAYIGYRERSKRNLRKDFMERDMHLHHHWGGASAFNKNMEEKAMKTRTLGLVAGMVLVAASAGFSQAAGLDKKADTNFSSNAAIGVPDILGSFDNTSAYQAMSEKEMKKIQGEHIWQPVYDISQRRTYYIFVAPSFGTYYLPRIYVL
ncbi:MAG: hypothetical protein ACTFAL_06790 [Candidatus Electronema sp. V4]|uniref:hypothetical protein n=1 Tax=Candidatus Electronema sp. V4 TaxID=3454756 RepID=UPI0040556B52